MPREDSELWSLWYQGYEEWGQRGGLQEAGAERDPKRLKASQISKCRSHGTEHAPLPLTSPGFSGVTLQGRAVEVRKLRTLFPHSQGLAGNFKSKPLPHLRSKNSNVLEIRGCHLFVVIAILSCAGGKLWVLSESILWRLLHSTKTPGNKNISLLFLLWATFTWLHLKVYKEKKDNSTDLFYAKKKNQKSL